jgi:hypothetical protein
MKQSMQIPALIIFTLLVVFPLAAMSEVKVTLKNGRDIIADSCSYSRDKLICEKMGGTFEIEKKDIADRKEVTIKRQETPSSPEEGAPSEKPASAEKNANQGSEGGRADFKMRLEEINQTKKELIPVRESLAKERERLNAEAKAQGTVLSPDVAASYKKKFNEIDAKINSFNKEIKKLNEEEQTVLHDMGRSPESMK